MSTNNTIQFPIRADRLREAHSKIKKLARRAKRLGLAVPRIDVGEIYMDPHPVDPRLHIARVLITIHNPNPIKVAGWTFLAALDHTGKGTVIRSFNSEACLAHYRQAPSKCEHCRTNRYRKTTYLLRNDDGIIYQVGSTCLVDFLGHDPIAAVAVCDFAIQQVRGLEEMQERGSGQSEGIELHNLLAWVSAIVRAEGGVYRGRQAARAADMTATCDLAIVEMSRHTTDHDIRPDNKDYEVGQAAINWARDLEVESDFDHNLKTIAKVGFIIWKQLGIGAYIFEAHRRAVAKAAEDAVASRRAETMEHVGTIGIRSLFNVILQRIRASTGYYGTTYQHVFIDTNGNELIWWGSRELDCDVGIEIKIKATVKKHEEYNGKPQTTINRVALA